MPNAFAAAIEAASAELAVEIARTSEQVVEAKRLRHRVYCEERGYEPGQNGLEQDEFDGNAAHVLLRSRVTGEVFGTVRLVLSKPESDLGFPMQRVCEDYVLTP